MPDVLKLLTSGADEDGASIDATGTFIDFQTAFETTANYFSINNRDATYPVLLNFNSGSKNITQSTKTIVVAPSTPFDMNDENISDVTIFCASGGSSLSDYTLQKRNKSREGF